MRSRFCFAIPPFIRFPPSVAPVLALWSSIVVSVLFLLTGSVDPPPRSLCTEETIYSIEPIYPPSANSLYYTYMPIMVLSFVEERTGEIKFS